MSGCTRLLFKNINYIKLLRMKHTHFLLLFGVLLMAGCFPCDTEEVQGCTDVFSENYNPMAVIDDGSCTYLYDGFVGVYLMSDTTETLDPQSGQLVTNTSQYTFSITKGIESTDVNVDAFAGCSNLQGVVSETLLSFSNLDLLCPNVSSVVVRKEGENLRISYDYSTFITSSVRGTARRQ